MITLKVLKLFVFYDYFELHPVDTQADWMSAIYNDKKAKHNGPNCVSITKVYVNLPIDYVSLQNCKNT